MMASMAFGGAVLSSLGAGSTLVLEKRTPTVKSLARDFIIGAFMLAMIMQLLPESTASLLQAVFAFLPASLPALGSVASATDDMEVRVGVPRF